MEKVLLKMMIFLKMKCVTFVWYVKTQEDLKTEIKHHLMLLRSTHNVLKKVVIVIHQGKLVRLMQIVSKHMMMQVNVLKDVKTNQLLIKNGLTIIRNVEIDVLLSWKEILFVI